MTVCSRDALSLASMSTAVVWSRAFHSWNSVMPAWEDRLTEEQIWQVILFLYDFTGYQPRRWEAGEHASH